MEIKKNPKADLGRRSLLFFQLGMIVMLFITWQALEWKTLNRGDYDSGLLDVGDEIEEVIPITEQLTTPPPPPPPPAVIAVQIIEVENESEIEESVIESTETNQNEEILEVEEIVEEVANTWIVAER